MAKEKRSNPWDRPKWPSRGNKTKEEIFTEVGRALSNWEEFDGAMGALFASFVSIDPAAAERAYASIRTFEARLDLVKAASEAYFDTYPQKDFQLQLKEIVKLAACFAPRRNEIAHGTVDLFREPGERDPIIELCGYGLFPPFASFKERTLEQVPTYCYVANQVNFFAACFNDLLVLASGLIGLIYRQRASNQRDAKLLRP